MTHDVFNYERRILVIIKFNKNLKWIVVTYIVDVFK